MELVRFFLTSRGLLKMRFYTSSNTVHDHIIHEVN